MSRKILDYYGESFFEDQRLCQDQGRIEWLRTLDILNRFLPPPPATVLDVGGATGAYSTFLLKSGYSVHLIDLVPSLVARAEKALLEAFKLGSSEADSILKDVYTVRNVGYRNYDEYIRSKLNIISSGTQGMKDESQGDHFELDC